MAGVLSRWESPRQGNYSNASKDASLARSTSESLRLNIETSLKICERAQKALEDLKSTNKTLEEARKKLDQLVKVYDECSLCLGHQEQRGFNSEQEAGEVSIDRGRAKQLSGIPGELTFNSEESLRRHLVEYHGLTQCDELHKAIMASMRGEPR